jgi:hypothetical protein
MLDDMARSVMSIQTKYK